MTRPVGRPITVRFDTPHCSCGKRTFATEAEARKQLHNAAAVRAEHGGYKQGRVETRVYQCVSGWHLTAEKRRGRR